MRNYRLRISDDGKTIELFDPFVIGNPIIIPDNQLFQYEICQSFYIYMENNGRTVMTKEENDIGDNLFLGFVRTDEWGAWIKFEQIGENIKFTDEWIIFTEE